MRDENSIGLEGSRKAWNNASIEQEQHIEQARELHLSIEIHDNNKKTPIFFK